MTSRPNTDQLRAAIDRGHTGDKAPASDPAAAPLGTDEEAAGTPIPPRAIAQAHAQETATDARMPTGQSAHPAPPHPATRPSRTRTLLIVVVSAAIVIAILLAITS